ncbi:F-box/LRR-repeat protein At5g63520-like isoform X1 [Malus sylvestris]|uniref:F-box/LRR-repeat protein At5g63520-like isoform X1 n=1 Tax=Malus sylvestris TaxID=3752 RepID=UPI0021ABC647|nr:F-box/LRR-repeat protein At5g63520-like isoform X1 [Malus sylvestris]
MFCSHRQSRGGKGNSMAVEQLKIGREQGVFSRVDDEILQSILGRLPGVEFSSAVGVNTNWNKNFGQMLSRPKFSSALSLNPDLHITEKIGCGVPIITNRTMGLIGTDVQAHNLNEVNWAQGNSARNAETIHRGIVVSVGYVPGLRVEVFPQPSPRHVSFVAMLRSMFLFIQSNC